MLWSTGGGASSIAAPKPRQQPRAGSAAQLIGKNRGIRKASKEDEESASESGDEEEDDFVLCSRGRRGCQRMWEIILANTSLLQMAKRFSSKCKK
jgi:hypothetical protein